MKKFAATVIASCAFAVPASALAATDLQSQIRFLLGQVAALTAQISKSTVVCAVASDRAAVKVGETYHIIWSSYGAKEPSNTDTKSSLARSGISEFIAQQPGTMKYALSLYGENGEEAKCSAILRILPQ